MTPRRPDLRADQPYVGPERRQTRRAVGELSRRRLAALSQAAGALVTATTVQQVTAIAVHAAVTATGAEGGTVALVDGESLDLISTEHYNTALPAAFPRLPLSAALPVCHAARTGERLLLRNRSEAVERFPQVAVHQELSDRAGVPIVSAAVLPLRSDDRLLGSLALTWSRERSFPSGDVELLDAIAALVARAVDRAERTLRRDAALAQASLLARTGELLTAGLDEPAVCAALVDLVVPALGQQAEVALTRSTAVAASATYASTGPSRAPVSDVQPLLPRQAGDPAAGRQRSQDTLQRCAVPIAVGGRRLGVLTALRGIEQPYTAQERALLRAVADRAAVALDTAVLLAEQRETSLALQRALLTDPPEPEHLHIVVRYQPASHAAVGGDWYDAVLTPDGATILVIGDVVGHDATAAAAMGQLRGLLRAIAYTSQDSPAGVLSRTERAALGLSVTSLATAVVARIERRPGAAAGRAVLRWSNGGHPPPALLRADGTVRMLEAEADLMLGVDETTVRNDHVVELSEGDTLLLYTDGLVERRDEALDSGIRRLAAHLSDLAAAPPDVLCDALLARMLRDGAEDDVALLAVRVQPAHQPPPRSAGPAGVPRPPR